MDSTETPESSTCPIPLPQRIISTHDPKTGLAVFTKALAETAPCIPIPNPQGSTPAQLMQLYSTSSFPVRGLSPECSSNAASEADADLKVYAQQLKMPPRVGEASPQATMCRIVDLPPGAASDMHRTLTLDYGVVLNGAAEWALDSGARRMLQKGDVLVQRGTAHSWRNVTSPDDNGGWLRMFFVLLPIEPVVVLDGAVLQPGSGLSKS